MEKAAVEAMRGVKSLDETDFVAAAAVVVVVIGGGAVWGWNSEGEIWRVGIVERVVVFERWENCMVKVLHALLFICLPV